MEKIYKYIEEHVTRQGEALDWVEKQTHIRTNHARMLSGKLQGELLRILVQISGARRILELGTFTGYSAICLASALPEDGHLDTLELNDELEDLILEGFEKAGLADRISLHIGDCKETLRKFREEGREYDLVYKSLHHSRHSHPPDRKDHDNLLCPLHLLHVTQHDMVNTLETFFTEPACTDKGSQILLVHHRVKPVVVKMYQP